MYVLFTVQKQVASTVSPAHIYVGFYSVDYADEWSHLGHTVTAECDDEEDIFNRRNLLNGQINNVSCYYSVRV